MTERPKYSVFVHNKHNTDWSDKSYDKLLTLNEDNTNNFLLGLYYYNTLDYDIMISRDDVIPNNENNIGMHRTELSIREKYEKVMDKFIDIYRLIADGKLDKYKPRFLSFIVKTDIFCIRFVSELYDTNLYPYIIHSISGEDNEKTCKEFHNDICGTPTYRKQKVITKEFYRKKFTNGREDTYKKKNKK